MGNTRECNGNARCDRIYAEYERVLQTYPVQGRDGAIKSIVAEVADILGYSPQYVRKVINSSLKGKKLHKVK